jgi:hypothetical protein
MDGAAPLIMKKSCSGGRAPSLSLAPDKSTKTGAILIFLVSPGRALSAAPQPERCWGADEK